MTHPEPLSFRKLLQLARGTAKPEAVAFWSGVDETRMDAMEASARNSVGMRYGHWMAGSLVAFLTVATAYFSANNYGSMAGLLKGQLSAIQVAMGVLGGTLGGLLAYVLVWVPLVHAKADIRRVFLRLDSEQAQGACELALALVAEHSTVAAYRDQVTSNARQLRLVDVNVMYEIKRQTECAAFVAGAQGRAERRAQACRALHGIAS